MQAASPCHLGDDLSMNTKVKKPVILVHGFNDKASKMRHISNYLRNSGWIIYSVTLSPSSGQIGIDGLANQLDVFIKENIQPNQKFDLIGFSMGGLICRYYIQRLGGFSRIEHFITISTPHNGTMMAYLLNNCGSRQMRLNSEFICDLNNDIGNLSMLKVTSIWTPLDLMVLPASSSHISVGDNIKIWCPLHPLMVSNYRCMQTVEAELLK
jgi:triacylglycerol lipase